MAKAKSEWSPATQKQINLIGALLRNCISADQSDIYWNFRKVKPKHLTFGEASDLINVLKRGDGQIGISIADRVLVNNNLYENNNVDNKNNS